MNSLKRSLLSLTLLVTSLCSAMDKVKQQTGLGALPEVCRKAFRRPQFGGIQGLAVLRKGNETICIIDYDRAGNDYDGVHTMTLPVGGVYTASEEASKALLLPFLNEWASAKEPVALVQEDLLPTSSHLKALYLQLPQVAAQRSVPLKTVLHFLTCLCDNNRYKNLHLVDAEEVLSIPHYDNPMSFFMRGDFFAKVAQQAGLSHDNFIKLDRIHIKSKEKQVAFFKKDGPFDRFVTSLQENATQPTTSIEQGLQTLQLLQQRTETLLTKTTNDALRAEAQKVSKMLTQALQDIPSYCASYCSEWKQLSHLEFLLTIIRTKKNFTKAFQEYKKVFKLPLFSYLQLRFYASIIETARTYKQVVNISNIAADDLDFYKKAGYSIEHKGRKVLTAEQVVLQQSPFSPYEVHTFLSSLFPKGKQLTSQGINPIKMFMIEGFEVPLHTYQAHPAMEVKYLNPKTGEVSTKPVVNTTPLECLMCQSKVPAFKALALFPKKQCTCTLACTQRRFLSKSKSLKRLLKKKELTPDEMLTLQHSASLCFLQYVSLGPTSTTAHGSYYELNHQQLSTLLGNLAKIQDPTWQKAFNLASSLGIFRPELITFNKKFMDRKQSYNTHILEHAKRKTYDDLSLEEAPEFDPKGDLARFQRKQYRDLRQLFGCNGTSPDLTYSRFYYHLMSTIQKRVPFIPDAFEVNFSVQGAPAEELLPQQAPEKEFYVEAYAPTDQIPTEAPVELPIEKPTPTIGKATIPCLFAQQVPYTIILFNACPLVPLEAQTGRALWATHGPLKASYRIKTITALADSIKDTSEIIPTEYGSFMLNCTDEEYDSSLREKLDLHHLFPPLVDKYLHKYGIPEQVGSLIQVSLPGTITFEDGTTEIGLFQTTFIPESWICIHRCFKRYTNQESKYISEALKVVLGTITELTTEEHK